MGILIGVSGVAGSGKDTVANYLVDKVGFIKVSFADPMKRICRDVFDFSEEQLWGPSQERNELDKRYMRYPSGTMHDHIVREIDEQELGISYGPPFLTPRYALQKLGTEWGRDCYENVWVEYALRLARTALANPTQYDYTNKYGLFPADRMKNPIQGVVIADCRFGNEVELVRKAGGKLIRVKRPGAGLLGEAGVHPSEKEQQGIPDSAFDYVIDNTGTLEDLEKKVLSYYEDLAYEDTFCIDQQVS